MLRKWQDALIAVEVIATMLLAAYLLHGLAVSQAPIGEPPVSALDYWLNRYQTLLAALVALAAAFVAYAVARYARRNELADAAQQTKESTITTLRSCLLDMEQMLLRAFTVYRASLEKGKPPTRQVEPGEFVQSAWITQTASILPSPLAIAVHRFYFFAAEADFSYRRWRETNDETWRAGSRLRLIQSDLVWISLVNALQRLEDGKEVEVPLSVGRDKARITTEHWDLTIKDFEEILRPMGMFDLNSLREAIEAREASAP